MAEWIRANQNLHKDPEVVKHARALNMNAKLVAYLWLELWLWAREHCSDGIVCGVSADDIDAVVETTNFAASAGKWLVVRKNKVVFTHWDKFNSNGARQRDLSNRRKSKWRLGNADGTPDRSSTVDQTRQERDETREEEEIEQNRNASASDLFSDSLVRSALRGVGVDGAKADMILTHEKATRANVLNATAQMKLAMDKGKRFTHPDRMLMRIAWNEPGLKEKVATARARTKEQFAALRKREDAA